MSRPALLPLVLVSLLLAAGCSKTPPPPETKKYAVEQFFKNKRIAGGTFSADGTRLLVTSNESGIMNLHEITVANGASRQITSSGVESYFAVDYVFGTGEILYFADKGGNEVDHIYLLAPNGTSRDLTPDPKEKAMFMGWTADRKAFSYISNKRDPRFFDLYRMDVGTWSPVLLFENNEGYLIEAVSWDLNTLALSRPVTTNSNRLFLYERDRRRLTEISRPEEEGNYSASGFSRDGKTFFYVTDAGREFGYLVRCDIAGGGRSTVYETDWDVMYADHSEKETYRVIGVNADGKNVLKVFETAGGTEVPFPPLPDGDVQGVAISPDEKQIRLSVGTSRAPSNIYVYSFDSKELRKLTETLNPDMNPSHLATAEVVRFSSFDGLEIPAVFYKPLDASPERKSPALVWVHGGPGGQSRVGYSSAIQYLVNQGYAVLAVNNRGSSGYGKTFHAMDDRNHGDKDLMDCIRGKEYLQSLPFIDSSKIGIIGGSYGGFMTMAAMTFHPDQFRVGVNLFGVTNWLRTLTSMPAYWEAQRKALYAEMGDPFSPDSVRLRAISPLFHAGRIRNPVMVLQGANDPRVLRVESDEIVEAMKANNVPVEYLVFDDEGHGFVKKENEIRSWGAVRAFLDTHLKGEGDRKGG
jgi:dipeptidyl aminopeptidase/acylaminoacyl peptidase